MVCLFLYLNVDVRFQAFRISKLLRLIFYNIDMFKGIFTFNSVLIILLILMCHLISGLLRNNFFLNIRSFEV